MSEMKKQKTGHETSHQKEIRTWLVPLEPNYGKVSGSASAYKIRSYHLCRRPNSFNPGPLWKPWLIKGIIKGNAIIPVSEGLFGKVLDLQKTYLQCNS